GVILDDGDPVGAKQVLLPLPRISRHVHRDTKTKLRADDSDRETEVSGRSHGDAVVAEELLGLSFSEFRVIIARLQDPRRERERLSMLQHLVDPAARLDRTRYGHFAVELHPQRARQLDARS